MAQIPKDRLVKGPYTPICTVGTVPSTFQLLYKVVHFKADHLSEIPTVELTLCLYLSIH